MNSKVVVAGRLLIAVLCAGITSCGERDMNAKAIAIGAVSIGAICTGMNCDTSEPSDLDKLGTVAMTINDQPFVLWIADDSGEQTQGLMHVTAEQMAPLPDGTRRGMIFVFDHEQELSFWMKNTIIPLDIAYLTTQGRITATYTMTALDTSIGRYRSLEPARIAIEVNAGVWNDLKVQSGAVLDIPESLLNQTP